MARICRQIVNQDRKEALHPQATKEPRIAAPRGFAGQAWRIARLARGSAFYPLWISVD
jgi:hypothetical protein